MTPSFFALVGCSAKEGIVDGKQKGRCSLLPAKENQNYYSIF